MFDVATIMTPRTILLLLLDASLARIAQPRGRTGCPEGLTISFLLKTQLMAFQDTFCGKRISHVTGPSIRVHVTRGRSLSTILRLDQTFKMKNSDQSG